MLLVDRHDLAAHVVTGSVQGDRQTDLQREIGELPDLRSQAAGADRHVTRTDADAPFGVEDFDGFDEIAVVRQWLAHAHEDQIVHTLAYMRLDLDDLFHDFCGGEIAREAGQAAGAEFAVVSTADLAGNTERAAVRVAAIKGGIGGDEDGLDVATVIQFE